VLVMTLVGALLTALVMAREWERGTLEALAPDLWPLAILAAITLPAAAWMFRRRLE
jgi:ABC-2 type transport system permease protein